MLVADLGCGRLELGRLLLPGVLPGGRVDGFDADPDQIVAARALIKSDGLRGLRVEEADARDVPRPDASYDRVVCQALLVHQSRPEETLQEMVRLARPGGWVAAVEPDIGAQSVLQDGEQLIAGLPQRAAAVARGARAMGVGSWDLAPRLASEFTSAGLQAVQVLREPGTLRLEPPYDEELRQTVLAWEKPESADAERSTVRWLAETGGMASADLDRIEAEHTQRQDERRRALRAGTWRGTVTRPLVVVRGQRGTGSL